MPRRLAWLAFGLAASVSWLGLPVTTDFSSGALAAGLLVMLALLK
jgi:hypothetical protein